MSRPSFCFGGLLIGLILGHAASGQAGTGAADDAFYNPPPSLSVAMPGTVIRMRPLAGAAALPSAPQNFLVLYHSTSPDARDVAVSGTVAIPAGTPPSGEWPLIAWTHGTTGMAPPCAPSRDSSEGPEHQRYLSVVEALLHGYAKRGCAVVATHRLDLE